MKAMLGTCVMIVCAVALSACGVDDPPSATDPGATDVKAQDSTAAPSMPVVVSIPKELSFNSLPEGFTIQGNEAITPSACRVKLEFCSDSRFGGIPSYCSNGCTFPNDFNAAISLCHSVCGNINCNTMEFVGGC